MRGKHFRVLPMPSSTVTSVTATLVHTATSISFDAFVLLALFVFFFFYALIAGKARALVFLYSLYPALLLARAFPFGGVLGSTITPAWQKFTVFLVALLLIAFLLRNIFFSYFPGSRVRRWFEAALISICTVGLGLVSIYQLIVPESATFLSGFFHALEPFIASPIISFFVLLAPIIASLLFGRKSFY